MEAGGGIGGSRVSGIGFQSMWSDISIYDLLIIGFQSMWSDISIYDLLMSGASKEDFSSPEKGLQKRAEACSHIVANPCLCGRRSYCRVRPE